MDTRKKEDNRVGCNLIKKTDKLAPYYFWKDLFKCIFLGLNAFSLFTFSKNKNHIRVHHSFFEDTSTAYSDPVKFSKLPEAYTCICKGILCHWCIIWFSCLYFRRLE